MAIPSKHSPVSSMMQRINMYPMLFYLFIRQNPQKFRIKDKKLATTTETSNSVNGMTQGLNRYPHLMRTKMTKTVTMRSSSRNVNVLHLILLVSSSQLSVWMSRDIDLRFDASLGSTLYNLLMFSLMPLVSYALLSLKLGSAAGALECLLFIDNLAVRLVLLIAD